MVAPSTYWVVFLLDHDLNVFIYLKWVDNKIYEIVNFSCNLKVAPGTSWAHWVVLSIHLAKHALLYLKQEDGKTWEAVNRYSNVDFVQLYNTQRNGISVPDTGLLKRWT